MVFSSITFLFYFLPIVLIIYYLIPNKYKNIVLLISSFIFYFYGEPKNIYIMILSILATYIFGILIDKYKKNGENRMNEKILVVDDEHDIADLLEVYLQNENYIVYKFYSAKDALTCIEQEELDLAILDIMLPDISGFSLCQKIREKHTYPIIMLTAKDEETDKITGLTLGADDYVTKPFRPLELIARVKAQLRRYKKYSPTPIEERKTNVLLTYDKLQLNTQTYECLLDGENVALTPTEFSILRILLEHKGTVVTVEDLFCSVWKDEYYSKNSSTITVHIRHLREKLQDTAEKPKYIKTIWGVGYKI